MREIQHLSGKFVASIFVGHLQEPFLKEVEAAARHDKLKRIGHPLRVTCDWEPPLGSF